MSSPSFSDSCCPVCPGQPLRGDADPTRTVVSGWVGVVSVSPLFACYQLQVLILLLSLLRNTIADQLERSVKVIAQWQCCAMPCIS